MKKILILLLLLIFPFQTLAFIGTVENVSFDWETSSEKLETTTEVEGIKINEYILNDKDKKIVDLFISKLYIVLEKRPDISVEKIFSLLEKAGNKSDNDRIKKIFEKVIRKIEFIENKVTILEWWNIFDIDEYLSGKNLIEKGDYILYVQNRDKIIALSKFFPFLDNQKTLEWYLYPDTYEMDKENFKINVFVIKQLEAFEVKVYNEILKDNYNNKSIEWLVNLGSIIEKEERNLSEKPTVSWIFIKRLKEKWSLWADITVCYPYKLTSEECKYVVSKYIGIETPYNSRFIKWLPPTPIWNPSFETINSLVNYKKTPYYYYLHDTDTGKIYYAETNEEHNENRSLYIK